ncbi:MAG: Nif3-like dinuclear metal center hexameric protein [Bacteroidales bacterium]|jgi:dinuclear metal center YbgI/SA1388 family protein|nr:Nif3-like dinuclear metal center hexameric protein [Bacteroidales bacterium]
MDKVRIREIIEEIEKFSPLYWQETYDNSGLILGDTQKDCLGAYICLDVSEDIIDEAMEKNCNLIISHHPIIFNNLKNIDYNSQLGKIIVKAIKNNITLYCCHTNMDNAFNGVNGILAEKIGLINFKPLTNDRIFKDENYLGGGALGELEKEISTKDFLIYLKEKLNLSYIKYNSNKVKQIKKVALCGGGGAFLIEKAIEQKADIFISGEIKYHQLLDNENAILLAEIGHFESEHFIKERIVAILNKKFCNFVPLFLKEKENRVKYL